MLDMPRGGIPAALARYLSTIGKEGQPPTKTGIEPNLNIRPPGTSVVIGNQHIPIDDVIPQRIKEAPRRNLEEEMLTDEAIQLDRVQGPGVGTVRHIDEGAEASLTGRSLVEGKQGNVNIRGKPEDITPFDAERLDAEGVERFTRSPDRANELHYLQEGVNNRLDELAEVAVGRDIPGELTDKLNNWRMRRDIAVETEDMAELRRIRDEFDDTVTPFGTDIERAAIQSEDVFPYTSKGQRDRAEAGQAVTGRERALKKASDAEDQNLNKSSRSIKDRDRLAAKDRAAAADTARLKQEQDHARNLSKGIYTVDDLENWRFIDEPQHINVRKPEPTPPTNVIREAPRDAHITDFDQNKRLLEALKRVGKADTPPTRVDPEIASGPGNKAQFEGRRRIGTKPKIVPLKSGSIDPRNIDRNAARLQPWTVPPKFTAGALEEQKIFDALPAALRARLTRRAKEPAKVDDKLARQLGDQFRNRPVSPPPKTIREEIDEMLARREANKANLPGEKNLTKKEVAALKHAREQLDIAKKNKARLSRKR
jgi:hypothetical protein